MLHIYITYSPIIHYIDISYLVLTCGWVVSDSFAHPELRVYEGQLEDQPDRLHTQSIAESRESRLSQINCISLIDRDHYGINLSLHFSVRLQLMFFCNFFLYLQNLIIGSSTFLHALPKLYVYKSLFLTLLLASKRTPSHTTKTIQVWYWTEITD